MEGIRSSVSALNEYVQASTGRNDAIEYKTCVTRNGLVRKEIWSRVAIGNVSASKRLASVTGDGHKDAKEAAASEALRLLNLYNTDISKADQEHVHVCPMGIDNCENGSVEQHLHLLQKMIEKTTKKH